MAREEDEIEQQSPAEPAAGEPKAPESISINVADDAEEDGDDAPAQRPGEKPTRRGGYKALKESNREMADRLARTERELAEMRGRMSAPAPVVVRESSAPKQDPAEAAIENIESQKQATLQAIKAAAAAGDQANVEKFTKQWNSLDGQRIRIETRAEIARDRASRPADDTDMKVGKQSILTRFPKLFEPNGEASEYGLEAQAEAKRIYKTGRNVGKSDFEIAEEAANAIYVRHGLGGQKKPAATDTDRARHTSTGTKPAGGGKDMWSPTKQQKVNALAYTEHRKGLSDEQRYRAWYNEVGKPGGLV